MFRTRIFSGSRQVSFGSALRACPASFKDFPLMGFDTVLAVMYSSVYPSPANKHQRLLVLNHWMNVFIHHLIWLRAALCLSCKWCKQVLNMSAHKMPHATVSWSPKQLWNASIVSEGVFIVRFWNSYMRAWVEESVQIQGQRQKDPAKNRNWIKINRNFFLKR